jgi:CDP-diacylglycerol--glycerol-3-phosphate 3-phosphatidyltransferase
MIPVFLAVLLIKPDDRPYNMAAAGVFLLASATDALDGYIARSRNLITNFGKFMDPLADKLLVCSALIALVGMGRVPSWIVVVIIAREFIVTGFRLVAAERNVVIAAGFWGKLKTVAQMCMVVAVIWGLWAPLSEALIWLSLVLTVVSGVEYIYKNRQILSDY